MTPLKRRVPAKKKPTRKRATKAKLEKPQRSKATFGLPIELLDELRVISMSVPPKDIGGSLSGLAERAFRREIEALRRRFNGGRPFKTKGAAKARVGRPPKV